MSNIDLITSNITVEMDTQLIPPAIVNCDITTNNIARIINIQLIDNCIAIKGILKKIITYKTFDIQSNIVQNSLFNETEFNALIEVDCTILENIAFIPTDSITITPTVLDNYISGIGEYHRAASLVAFNLTEDTLLTISADPSKFLTTAPADFLIMDDFYPQLSNFTNRNVSIPLKGPIYNCKLSNLNIKRFFVTNVNKIFSEGILCDCCILYSFFNQQDELICSDRVNFHYIINSKTINSVDDYTIIGSDILNVLDSNIVNNNLNETLSLKIISQRID